MKDKDPKALLSSFPLQFGDELHKLHQALTGVIGRPPRVIQFTSSQFDEGVTTVTLGFGVFLGRIHGPDSVLAVECNFRRPSFQDLFGVAQDKGVQSVLAGNCQIEEAVFRSQDPAISILALETGGGAVDPLSSEAGRLGLKTLFNSLQEKYRFVLVDIPPVLPFADASMLCGLSDGIVLVLEANRTRAEQVNDALDRLRSAGAKALGIILNKREFHIPNYIYRYL
jgi:Mrp family chromosome partitioning ATPase